MPRESSNLSVVPGPTDRLKGEPLKAYQAFLVYRDMAPTERSARAVAKRTGKRSHRRLEQWSSKWHWVERAAAWDALVDQTYQQARLDDVVRLKSRHLEQIEALRQVCVREVAAYLRRSKEADVNAEGKRGEPLLKPNELLRLSEQVITMGRLILGQPTEHTETTEAYDPSNLSDDDLRTLVRLRAKARGE